MGKSKIKKDEGGGGGSGDWLNTYADMVTLLLTFFILLYSFSSVNPVKWDQLVQTYGNKKSAISSLIDGGKNQEEVEQQIENIMNAIIESMENQENTQENTSSSEDETMSEGELIKTYYTFSTIYQVIKSYIEENELDSKLTIEKDENFVMIRFKDRALFDSGSINLKSDSMEIIRFIVSSILMVIDEVDEISVEGHTDNVPIKTRIYQSNRFLSSARADTVCETIQTYGIPPEMLVAIGCSEYRPIATNDTEEGRAQNRRVEIRITRKSIDNPLAPTAEMTIQDSQNVPEISIEQPIIEPIVPDPITN